jgi:hypothetical protein
MITGLIQIRTTEHGIVVEQVALTDQTNATPEERIMAGVLDIGIRVAGEFVVKNVGNGVAIEGKDIEQHVSKLLEKEHTASLRDQLRAVGIELPPQR